MLEIFFCYFYFREKKREREREELWKRLHELADEIQKGDKHGTIGGTSLPAPQSSQVGDVASNQLNSTATNNQNNNQAAGSHSASAISTQMNSLSISAGSMSK